jgi:hypothetical protein
METQKISTIASRDKQRRYNRIVSCYKELKEKYGQLSATRLATIVASIETQYLDGVKTVLGIIYVLKKHHLWFPRPQKNN